MNLPSRTLEARICSPGVVRVAPIARKLLKRSSPGRGTVPRSVSTRAPDRRPIIPKLEARVDRETGSHPSACHDTGLISKEFGLVATFIARTGALPLHRLNRLVFILNHPIEMAFPAIRKEYIPSGSNTTTRVPGPRGQHVPQGIAS